MYTLAQQLLSQGVPLDGIGCQGHLIVGSVPSGIATNYARFAALGLEWALTGMRVRERSIGRSNHSHRTGHPHDSSSYGRSSNSTGDRLRYCRIWLRELGFLCGHHNLGRQ